jgi:uncharacterized membrane protein YsdA (DUF1294 family)
MATRKEFMPKQAGSGRSIRRHGYHYFATVGGLGLTAVLLLLFNFTTSWPFHLTWLLSLSVTTFVLFGVDKGLASGPKRIPEIVLHLFTLLGGFPGQFFGRLTFRHKVSREKRLIFNLVLIISFILHGGLVYLLYFY